ncbi:MAG: glycosyltransferase family 2 protein [Desulfobacterales bacterium]
MIQERERIAVIVLTYNQRDLTLKCIESLLAATRLPFHTVVWDNGSHDGTSDALQKMYPQVLVHHHDTNLGVASGRNAAADLAMKTFDATHLLFLDNDMVVAPGFVDALFRPFRENGRVGQTQAKLRYMHDPERLNDGGGARISYLLWRITPVGVGEVDRGQHDTVKKCTACGGAMMVRADIFRALDGFDPKFGPFGPEDLDFSLRLQKAGHHALYIPQAVAYHLVNHTMGRGYTEEYARHKMRHWFIFMRRHASMLQQLGFFCLGAPYLVFCVLMREGRKGNYQALRGLFQGLIDYSRASLGKGVDR